MSIFGFDDEESPDQGPVGGTDFGSGQDSAPMFDEIANQLGDSYASADEQVAPDYDPGMSPQDPSNQEAPQDTTKPTDNPALQDFASQPVDFTQFQQNEDSQRAQQDQVREERDKALENAKSEQERQEINRKFDDYMASTDRDVQQNKIRGSESDASKARDILEASQRNQQGAPQKGLGDALSKGKGFAISLGDLLKNKKKPNQPQANKVSAGVNPMAPIQLGTPTYYTAILDFLKKGAM